ncbi:M16 family metallopeptidase [Daejeonella sp.]|jgi:predicted Zn-dependent peptidase|uniref:M16 family metallopeptidase n=1 Tax=Daejeonella sp. TaxID=2805397 RepID=UPI003784E92E
MKKFIRNISAILITGVLCSPAIAQNTPTGFKVPAYEKFSLPNGLTVYLMEQHEVPLISLSAIVPAGAIHDAEKSGLANLTAAGLQYGTKSYSKTKIEEELDFIGADLSTYASKESATITSKFAAKDADKVLSILKEVMVDPIFDKDEFEKERKRVLSSLEQAKLSPRNVINAYWDKFIYGSHVYANPVNGSPATVGKFSVDDLKTFYKNNYGPQGSAIAIVGDFNTKMMKARIISLFGAWKKTGLPQNNLAAQVVSPPQTARVLLVNKEDARETTFLIGGMGIRRDNPDFVAIEVVNTVFGGRFTSWLNDELRVNSGLTYGARSSFSPLKNSGTFSISTFTAVNTTLPTVEKTLQVLDSLHSTGLDEKTLASAKNYVKGQFPPRYETAGQLAGLLTQMFWYGFNESFINNFQSNVDGLSLARSKEIITKYFPKDKLQFLLIGKSEDIKSIASKYGPVIEKDIKADGF